MHKRELNKICDKHRRKNICGDTKERSEPHSQANTKYLEICRKLFQLQTVVNTAKKQEP